MPLDESLEALATQVIDVCFHVRRDLGAGLYESVYKTLVAHRLRKLGRAVRTEVPIRVAMDGLVFPLAGRADLVVDEVLLVEAKAVRELHPVHSPQVLTYPRFSDLRLGILVNFHALPFGAGVRRYVRHDHEPPTAGSK